MLNIVSLAAQGRVTSTPWVPTSYIARICRSYLVFNTATSRTIVGQEACLQRKQPLLYGYLKAKSWDTVISSWQRPCKYHTLLRHAFAVPITSIFPELLSICIIAALSSQQQGIARQ